MAVTITRSGFDEAKEKSNARQTFEAKGYKPSEWDGYWKKWREVALAEYNNKRRKQR